MHKAHGRLKPAENFEAARLIDRYFKCEKCGKTVVLTHIEFAEKKVCVCGGNLHEINPYKGQVKW